MVASRICEAKIAFFHAVTALVTCSICGVSNGTREAPSFSHMCRTFFFNNFILRYFRYLEDTCLYLVGPCLSLFSSFPPDLYAAARRLFSCSTAIVEQLGLPNWMIPSVLARVNEIKLPIAPLLLIPFDNLSEDQLRLIIQTALDLAVELIDLWEQSCKEEAALLTMRHLSSLMIRLMDFLDVWRSEKVTWNNEMLQLFFSFVWIQVSSQLVQIQFEYRFCLRHDTLEKAVATVFKAIANYYDQEIVQIVGIDCGARYKLYWVSSYLAPIRVAVWERAKLRQALRGRRAEGGREDYVKVRDHFIPKSHREQTYNKPDQRIASAVLYCPFRQLRKKVLFSVM